MANETKDIASHEEPATAQEIGVRTTATVMSVNYLE
jgi:hypothetical protein